MSDTRTAHRYDWNCDRNIRLLHPGTPLDDSAQTDYFDFTDR